VTPAALLLDLDGTLVDSEPIHRRGYAAFFADRGWEVRDLSIFTGRRAEDVFATEPGPWSAHDPGDLASAVLPFLPSGALPRPVTGAVELIAAAAAAGVPLALVTSAGGAWVDASLGGALDVRAHFATLVTADDVVDGKPDPAGYRLAAARLDVPAAQCLVVEDSPAGIAAALGAGVDQVHAVTTTHPARRLREAGAVEVYADLRPLVALV